MAPFTRPTKPLRYLLGLLLVLCIPLHALAQRGPSTAVTEFDRVVNAGIKRIVIAKSSSAPVLIERLGEIMLVGSTNTGAALSFGVVGALFASGGIEKNQANSRELSARVKALGFDVHDVYADRVKEALERAGYEVRLVPAPPRLPAAKFVADLAGIAGADEAVLDLGFLVPTMEWSSDTKRFIPILISPVRLARAEGQSIVYRRLFVYGASDRAKLGAYFPADEKYLFESFDAMMQNDKLVAEAYQAGAAALAGRIAADLKRQVAKSDEKDIGNAAPPGDGASREPMPNISQPAQK